MTMPLSRLGISLAIPRAVLKLPRSKLHFGLKLQLSKPAARTLRLGQPVEHDPDRNYSTQSGRTRQNVLVSSDPKGHQNRLMAFYAPSIDRRAVASIARWLCDAPGQSPNCEIRPGERARVRQPAVILQWDESFDIGSDTITGINDADYKPPFPLTAKFNKLTIKIDRPQFTAAPATKLDMACVTRRGSSPVKIYGEDLP
jgi:hypothetical protein